jgi:hypothetical protein
MSPMQARRRGRVSEICSARGYKQTDKWGTLKRRFTPGRQPGGAVKGEIGEVRPPVAAI